MKVGIVAYDTTWPDQFAKAKGDLEVNLQSVPICSIEHVGSTAIVGLPAKPVLDIDIIVEPDNVPAARQALVAAGYFDCGEMDIPGRFAFRQPGYGQGDAAWGHGSGASKEARRNTYVMVRGCLALRNHLDVKATLLQHEDLRSEYAATKLELCQRDFADIGEYVMAKNDILCKILARSEWSDEDLNTVRPSMTK